MPKKPTIIEAMDSPELFRPLFKDMNTWKAWRTALKALYGLKFEGDEQGLFTEYTGRKTRPSEGFKEMYCICGARGGKSYVSALIACYVGLFGDFSKHLVRGEKAWIFLIATDKDQARIIFDYIHGILELFPEMIERELVGQIELKNHINICVKTCDYRSGRGFSTACVILDELAFYRTETSANPAEELLISLLPRLLPNGLLIGISTPYGKFGLLFEIFKAHYGVEDSDILVWKAPTMVMNPTYKQSLIDRLLKRDKVKMRAEYMAEFREDVETYLSDDELDAVTDVGRKANLPLPGTQYFAFCDMSGGRKDSFALSIGHNENGKAIIDRIELRNPQDPATVCDEFTMVLKHYGLSRLQGDRYAGEWPKSAFDKRGINYEISQLTKNDIYLHFQPIVSMHKVQLLDNELLKNQLLCLERKTRQGGKDAIEHPRGLFDDLANAVAGCAVSLIMGSTVELTPEYMAQRLPCVRGHSYPSLFSETAQQEQRVMKKLREEGEL